jgi:hypothetical protein
VPRVRAVPPRLSAPEGATVGDRSTASREPWARTALGRACAPHYWRRPGRGSRPRPPSSRFHGFGPHEPDRPAPRIGVDSLTFSIEYMRSPGRGVVEQTEVRKDRTPSTYAGGSSVCTSGDPIRSSKLRQCLARRRQPLTSRANYPIAMCVRPCNPPPPRLIERLEAAQVNVQAGDYSRLDAKFSGVWQKRRTDGGFWFAVAVSGW